MKTWKQSTVIGIAAIIMFAFTACEKKAEVDNPLSRTAAETAQAAEEIPADRTGQAAAEMPAINPAEPAAISIQPDEPKFYRSTRPYMLRNEVSSLASGKSYQDFLQGYIPTLQDSFPLSYLQENYGVNPQDIDVTIGTIAYMRYIVHRFWAGTDAFKDLVDKDHENAMADRYNAILQEIISEGRINRDELTSFYRNNIRELVIFFVGTGVEYGPFDEVVWASESDVNNMVNDISNFLLNPNDNLMSDFIRSDGKYFSGESGIPLDRFMGICRDFDFVRM